MLANQEIERPVCMFFSNILSSCKLTDSIPLATSCSLCYKRIGDLSTLRIKSRFSSEEYFINQIPLEKKPRSYISNNDCYKDPVWIQSFHPSIRANNKLVQDVGNLRYGPIINEKIRFNLFNIKTQEYSFEIFELKKTELPNFIWYLEEFGYSEQLLSKFKKNIELEQ